jgi:Family of unknown function (DUF6130)
MQRLALLLVAVVAGGAAAWAQTPKRTGAESAPRNAKEVRGATPYVEIKNEPAPKLIVDPPLPEGLALGIVWIQYRVENLRIVPVFGEAALKISPLVGHLHITVDDLPWWWAEASDNNTIDIAGLPVGKHKVRIELVNPNHQLFPGQTKDGDVHIASGCAPRVMTWEDSVVGSEVVANAVRRSGSPADHPRGSARTAPTAA